MAEFQGIEIFSKQVTENWKKSRLVIKSEELEFKTEANGISARAVNNNLDFANCQISSFIREIPAGWKSGKHKHHMEAIIMIIQGAGYTVVDGKKYEWKKGDILTIPPLSIHQHFNPSTKEAVRFHAVTTMPLMVNIGSFIAEQIEPPGKI